jgi:ribonucleoside-diphosphate reductase alpha chain
MELTSKILSDITVFQKYAKFLPELGRRENWEDLCKRNMDMHITKYPDLAGEIRSVYKNYVLTKKVLPSMRSMQFGGRPIELSNNRMFNCAYVAADNPAAFWEAMFLLLGGSGVGYSVQNRHVDQLPVVVGPIAKTRRFLVGDSIEGWADAVKVLMRAYFEGKSEPVFDFRDIRPKGARLVTSGGKAPGPDPLRLCLDQLRKVLNNSVGRKLKPIEAHDIMCHIADAVLSGGIRRAALISLFSHDDYDMLSAKSGPWWELNPQRGRANNSVVLKRGEVTREQFDHIWGLVEASGAGEPGFYWTNDEDYGTNPCCFSGDSLVATSQGEVKIKELVDRVNDGEKIMIPTFNINSGLVEEKTIVAGMLSKKNAKIISLEIVKEDGSISILKCTPDHRIFTKNRGWVEAINLNSDDDIAELQLS